MTEKQYENLMYALSKIIVLLERNNIPQPVHGIPYNEVERQAKELVEKQTHEVYKNITGDLPKREIAHTVNSSSQYAKELDEQSKADAKRAELEEKEKARLKKLEDEELARKEEEAANLAALESLCEEADDENN